MAKAIKRGGSPNLIKGQAQANRAGICRSIGCHQSLPGVQHPSFPMLSLEAEIGVARAVAYTQIRDRLIGKTGLESSLFCC